MTDTDLPPSTPLDVRRGLTDPKDIHHPLRWGILGTGNISAQWVWCLQQVPGATITAAAARDKDRAQAFADRNGIPTAYGSYAEMVAAPDVDVVYIGTITRLHKEHSLLAIEAGKHVLCEKALAEDAADAAEMYAAALDRGVMLQDAMWTRFFPAVEHARFAIESGVIGDVSLVQSDFFDPIYTIQAAVLGFGADAEPTRIVATGLRAGGAMVEYADGDAAKVAVLTFPRFPSEMPEVTEIVGSLGRITLQQPGHCPTGITIRVPPAGGVPSRYQTRNVPAPTQHFEYPLPGNVGMETWYPNQHGFLYQAEAVHRCLAAGLTVCPQYDEAESMHAMRLLTKINAARLRA